MEPKYAYLNEKKMTAKPVDDVLSYRFLFIEAQSMRPEAQNTEFYLAKTDGESLWDIAYVYGLPIERLTVLNPQIPLIDELSRGERVRIC